MYELFDEFRKLPRNVRLKNPHALVQTNIPDVFFTRVSLKHLAEKDKEGRESLDVIPQLFYTPEEIYQGKSSNRYLFIKRIFFRKKYRIYVLILETMPNQGHIIVTLFQSTPRYLSNFELLWRAEGS
jgi:hypothetical protein